MSRASLISPKLRIRTVHLWVLCLAWMTVDGQRLVAAEPSRDEGATTQDLLFLAGEHPVVVRVHMLIDGASIDALRRVYSDYMFRQLDLDQDETLDEQEAREVRAIGAWQEGGPVLGDRWSEIDNDPHDGKVSADEFSAYFNAAIGAPFNLTAVPERAEQTVHLFSRLDIDGDGHVTADELEAAHETIHKLDLDDDETFSIEELQPYPEPTQNSEMAGAEVAGQPFVALGDAPDLLPIVAELLKRFDSAATGTTDGRLDAREMGLDETTLNAFDQDGDDALNEAELAAFLGSPAPHVELEVYLPKRRRGSPGVSVLADATASAPASRSPQRSVSMGWAGRSVDVGATAAGVATSDATNFYKSQLLIVDTDKNRYLDEGEFGRLDLPGATFQIVDRNQDGKIYPNEVTVYVQQAAILTQSQVVMYVGREGTTLFEILDSNFDRRLTLREFQEAGDRIKEFDSNHDGKLAGYELDSRYEVTLEVGRPPLFQNQMVPNRNLARVPNVSRPMEGPVWFRKMDSNRDGDLSWREFLGPRTAFDKIDIDANGLIDPTEAAAAE